MKKKVSELKFLYSKLVKLSSKVDIQRTEISRKTKDLVETEVNLKKITTAIFENELKLYDINLQDLNNILVKNLPIESVNSIMQTCLKYAGSIFEGSKTIPGENIIPVVSCTCEGRMNICYSENNEELPQCPIMSKSSCDGKRLHAVFVKRNK